MSWEKVDLGTVLKDESMVLAFFLDRSMSDNILCSSDVKFLQEKQVVASRVKMELNYNACSCK